MIKLDEEDGLSLCGRVTCGFHVGFITEIGRRTYRIHWDDGSYTTQLRPDADDENQAEAA